MSLMGNSVYNFTSTKENIEDILLQNINNWSHSVSASSLIFPGLSLSCNELKSDENCLLLLTFCPLMLHLDPSVDTGSHHHLPLGGILQEGGLEAHQFISATDKDLNPIFDKICGLSSFELFTIAD